MLQESLVVLLKKKGTGATMSKSLSADELLLLSQCFASPDCELTTKATILTAFLMLENTAEESVWLSGFKAVPAELSFLMTGVSLTRFQALILRVIRHENLGLDEMRDAMTYYFDPALPEYEKAVFLEAERLKRETVDENVGCYEGLWTRALHHDVAVPILVDLSVGYDGFNRSLCLWLFVAPLLAAVGVPAIVHGVDAVSPKFGVNPYQILKLAGKDPVKSMADVEKNLLDIGWGYVDQSVFFSELFGMTGLRTRMVKRPILATLEKLMQPFRADGQTYLVTGYTHPPYRVTMGKLLDRTDRYDHTMILRGVEGSIQLPLDRRAPCIVDGVDDFVRPEDYGCADDADVSDHTLTASDSLAAGLAVLRGEDLGDNRKTVVYLARVILGKFGLPGTDRLEEAIASGAALECWERF